MVVALAICPFIWPATAASEGANTTLTLNLLAVSPAMADPAHPMSSDDRGETAQVQANPFGRVGSPDSVLRALQLARSVGDTRTVTQLQLSLGLSDLKQGQLAAARSGLEAAWQEARKVDGDPEPRAAVLADLGVLHALQGHYADALQATQDALEAYRQMAQGPRPVAPSPAPSSARATLQAQWAQAQAQILQETSRLVAQTGIMVCTLNLAAIHAQLGHYGEAFRLLDQASPKYSALVLHVKAAIAARAGQPAQAQAFAHRAAQVSRDDELTPTTAGAVALSGPVAPVGEAGATGHADLHLPAAAMAIPSAALMTLQNDAQRAQLEGHAQLAFELWGRVALVAEPGGHQDLLRQALAGRQQAALALGQLDASIYYGKRAVEEIQRQRTGLAALDRDARRSFANASRRVFESLASALMDAQRLPEAERALLLLRQDDVADLVPAAARLPQTVAEAALRADELRLVQQMREVYARSNLATAPTQPELAQGLGRMYAMVIEHELVMGPAHFHEFMDAFEAVIWPRPDTPPPDDPQPPGITFEMLRQIARLPDCPGHPPAPLIQASRAQAQRLLERARREGIEEPLPPALSRGNDQGLTPDDIRQLPRCLAEDQDAVGAQMAGPPAALLNALSRRPVEFAAPARLVVDAGRAALARQADHSVAIHYLVLDTKLRILLVSDQGWVVRDVAVTRPALVSAVQAHADAISVPTRNPLPAAQALYAMLIQPIAPDLGQRSATALLIQPDGPIGQVAFAALHDDQHWLIERFALAESTALASGQPSPPPEQWRLAAFGSSAAAPGFAALPSVKDELAGIVAHRTHSHQWLDSAFTANALRDALAQHYSVMHIASHFVLNDQDMGASYLLLGDGGRLTLRELGGDAYALNGVELVTLSACETARDTRDAWGQSFSGLAALLRQRGAASVMSTLWPVADASTAALMKGFYTARAASGKATSLRQAQLDMLQGRIGSSTEGTSRGVIRPGREAWVADPDRPWAHPFYWAPFVLTGEWR